MTTTEVHLDEIKSPYRLDLTPLEGEDPAGIVVGTIVSREVVINHFLVYPEYRGLRLGPQMLTRLENWGQEQKAFQIVFYPKDEADLVGFLEHSGFVKDGPYQIAKPLLTVTSPQA